MSRITPLYELQQIDSGLSSRILRMRQIDNLMVDGPELLSVRAVYEEIAARLAAEQASLKKLSHIAEETSTRLRTLEKRLYDGTIKSPKELNQAQEEVGHLKLRLKDQEDEVIDAIMQSEATEEQVQARRADLDLIEKEFEQYKAGLLEEKEKLLAQAKVLQVKRQRHAAAMLPGDLVYYERYRKSKAGVAIAGVREGQCVVCHVEVPANVVRAARLGTDFTVCPSCGRILYPLGDIRFKEANHDLDNVDK
ncbi:MAG: C4-type zinc ribbon domain-containing protein [Chloroflexota bacterium]|nr:C4-type zinc ribbon domain-containing protein [Chloroflexota bacterium]